MSFNFNLSFYSYKLKVTNFKSSVDTYVLILTIRWANVTNELLVAVHDYEDWSFSALTCRIIFPDFF